MTNPVPVPAALLSSDFPAPADRQAGTFNAKAFSWSETARQMSVRDREIAVATHTNALAAKEGADAAVPAAATAVTARNESVTARNESVTARNESVAARNAAVPAAAQALDAAQRAEDAAAGIADGPVTSVNGKTGVVSLQVQDIPGLTDLVRLQRVQVTANTALGAGQLAKFLDCKGAITLSVPSPAALGAGWYCYLRNTGNQNINLIGIGTTYSLAPGSAVLVQCDGTAFTVLELKKRTYSQRLQIESTQDFVVPPDTYVIRAYAVGAGANGGAAVPSTSTGAGGSGGGMAYGDIAVTPGETLSVTIADRIAKVSRGATDLLVGNPAAHSVNATPGAVGTASKHSSVTNGGAYSGGLGGAGTTATSAAGGSGASSGSPLGNGVAGTTGAAGSGFGGSGGSGFGGSGGSAGGGFPGGGGGTGGNGGSGSGSVVGFGGPGLPDGAPVLDPLLRDCVAPQNKLVGINASGADGRPGQGGTGSPGNAGSGGNGGFGGGGGGGGGTSGTGNGGNGGFGGGGGSAGIGGNGGNGGFGGGGAGGRVDAAVTRGAGTGGAAAVVIIWD